MSNTSGNARRSKRANGQSFTAADSCGSMQNTWASHEGVLQPPLCIRLVLISYFHSAIVKQGPEKFL